MERLCCWRNTIEQKELHTILLQLFPLYKADAFLFPNVRGRIGGETGVGGSEESRSWVSGIHGRG